MDILLQEEEYTFNPQRVTVILPYDNTLWIGTGMGEVLVYQIRTYQSKFSLKLNQEEIWIFNSLFKFFNYKSMICKAKTKMDAE